MSNIMNLSQKRLTLITASMASFLTSFMSSSINIALPSIGNRFSLTAVNIGWITASYLLSSAIFLLPFGRLADIYGKKRIFSAGIVFYALASTLCAVAMSGHQLILFRGIQGIAAAMIFGMSLALVIDAFEAHERGKALGVIIGATYIGLSIGPFIGGLLTHYAGWRSIFVANALAGITVILFDHRITTREHHHNTGEGFDLAGSLVYAAAFACLMLGMSRLPSTTGALLAAGGVAGLAVFFWWELRVQHPLLEMRLFLNNSVFALSNLATLINYAATFAVGFLLSLYLQYIKGYPAALAGTVMVVQPVIQAIFSPAAGRLSDRIEPRAVASAGMGLTALGVLLLAFTNANTPVWHILLILALLGSGFALFSSPNTNAVMAAVEKRYYGVASATISTMRLTGHMLSMGMVMIIFSLHMGTNRITPELHGAFIASMRTMFIISTLLCTAGIFASLARGKIHS